MSLQSPRSIALAALASLCVLAHGLPWLSFAESPDFAPFSWVRTELGTAHDDLVAVFPFWLPQELHLVERYPDRIAVRKASGEGDDPVTMLLEQESPEAGPAFILGNVAIAVDGNAAMLFVATGSRRGMVVSYSNGILAEVSRLPSRPLFVDGQDATLYLAEDVGSGKQRETTLYRQKLRDALPSGPPIPWMTVAGQVERLEVVRTASGTRFVVALDGAVALRNAELEHLRGIETGDAWDIVRLERPLILNTSRFPAGTEDFFALTAFEEQSPARPSLQSLIIPGTIVQAASAVNKRGDVAICLLTQSREKGGTPLRIEALWRMRSYDHSATEYPAPPVSPVR